MNDDRRGLLRPRALAVALALLALACGPGAASTPSGGAAPASGGASAPAPAGGAGAPAASAPSITVGPPERSSLKVGLPVDATSFLPVYLAAEHTYQEEGLKVDVLGFRGDAEVAQALAADSVDFDVASLNGLINMTTAGQPVKGFYAGFYQADFDWIAKAEVKTWADMKGRGVGISTYGALTDFLTRYALRKHGLEPERDVPVPSRSSDAGDLESPWQCAQAAGSACPAAA